MKFGIEQSRVLASANCLEPPINGETKRYARHAL